MAKNKKLSVSKEKSLVGLVPGALSSTLIDCFCLTALVMN